MFYASDYFERFRDKKVMNKYFLAVCVRMFLEKRERAVHGFIQDFQKLPVSDEKVTRFNLVAEKDQFSVFVLFWRKYVCFYSNIFKLIVSGNSVWKTNSALSKRTNFLCNNENMRT